MMLTRVCVPWHGVQRKHKCSSSICDAGEAPPELCGAKACLGYEFREQVREITVVEGTY